LPFDFLSSSFLEGARELLEGRDEEAEGLLELGRDA
jgi:hypothetical protein